MACNAIGSCPALAARTCLQRARCVLVSPEQLVILGLEGTIHIHFRGPARQVCRIQEGGMSGRLQFAP